MNYTGDLYKEIILDHYKSKVHKHRIEDADFSNEGANPSCGDEIELFLKVEGDTITEASYEGMGCSISIASADMLCEALHGMKTGEARQLIGKFRGMLTKNEEPDFPDEISDLEAMQGVRQYPLRIKCALLSWTTLEQILDRVEEKG